MTIKTYFELSNTQKAALLLIALGKNTSSEMIKHLSESEIKEIAYWIHRMPLASSEMLKNVVGEFYHRLYNIENPSYRGGKEYVFDLLLNSYGEQKAKSFLTELERPIEKPSNLKNVLSSADSGSLAELLTREASETVALLFCHQDETAAADIFSKMPLKKQLAILIALAEFDQLDPDSMTALVKQSRDVFDSSTSEFKSPPQNITKVAASLLKNFNKSGRISILNELEKMKPEFTAKINNALFIFDELSFLDEAKIKDVNENTPPNKKKDSGKERRARRSFCRCPWDKFSRTRDKNH
jgi:flagellar motor switch protein FliG